MPINKTDAAYLADWLYAPDQALPADVSSRYTLIPINGQKVFKGPSGSGYEGAMFLDNQTGQMVVVSKGTDIDKANDITTDAFLAKNTNLQKPDADLFYQDYVLPEIQKRGLKESDTTFVGHSLGGNTSQILAAEHNANAVTFNSAGAGNIVKSLNAQYDPGKITNYVTLNDPISALLPQVGQTVVVPQRIGTLDPHDISNFEYNFSALSDPVSQGLRNLYVTGLQEDIAPFLKAAHEITLNPQTTLSAVNTLSNLIPPAFQPPIQSRDLTALNKQNIKQTQTFLNTLLGTNLHL